jgi:hypothetical protein
MIWSTATNEQSLTVKELLNDSLISCALSCDVIRSGLLG